jgi:hypothetical protein
MLAGNHVKVVSERLGHSTVAITMDIYSHVLPTMQKEATIELEKILRGGTSTGKNQAQESNQEFLFDQV